MDCFLSTWSGVIRVDFQATVGRKSLKGVPSRSRSHAHHEQGEFDEYFEMPNSLAKYSMSPPLKVQMAAFKRDLGVKSCPPHSAMRDPSQLWVGHLPWNMAVNDHTNTFHMLSKVSAASFFHRAFFGIAARSSMLSATEALDRMHLMDMTMRPLAYRHLTRTVQIVPCLYY